MVCFTHGTSRDRYCAVWDALRVFCRTGRNGLGSAVSFLCALRVACGVSLVVSRCLACGVSFVASRFCVSHLAFSRLACTPCLSRHAHACRVSRLAYLVSPAACRVSRFPGSRMHDSMTPSPDRILQQHAHHAKRRFRGADGRPRPRGQRARLLPAGIKRGEECSGSLVAATDVHFFRPLGRRWIIV